MVKFQGRSDEAVGYLIPRSLSQKNGWVLPSQIAGAYGLSDEDEARAVIHKFLALRVGKEAPELTPHEIACRLDSILARFQIDKDNIEIAISLSWLDSALRLSKINPDIPHETKVEHGLINEKKKIKLDSKRSTKKQPGRKWANKEERNAIRAAKLEEVTVAVVEQKKPQSEQEQNENAGFALSVIASMKKNPLTPAQKESDYKIFYWTAVDIIARRISLMGYLPPEDSESLVEEVKSIRENYNNGNAAGQYSKPILEERLGKVSKAMAVILFEKIADIKKKKPDCTVDECAKIIAQSGINYIQSNRKFELAFDKKNRNIAWKKTVQMYQENRFNNLA